MCRPLRDSIYVNSYPALPCRATGCPVPTGLIASRDLPGLKRVCENSIFKANAALRKPCPSSGVSIPISQKRDPGVPMVALNWAGLGTLRELRLVPQLEGFLLCQLD